MSNDIFHKQAQPLRESEMQASVAKTRHSPQIQESDVVVTNTRQMPHTPCSSPSTAVASSPVMPSTDVMHVEQDQFLWPVNFCPAPMLFCAVQDVKPLMEHRVAPMVMMDKVLTVPEDVQGDDVAIAHERELKDSARHLQVSVASQMNVQVASSYDDHVNVEEVWTPKQPLLTYTVKNTFIEVENSPAYDGESTDQLTEGFARQKSRARSLPSRESH